MVWWVYIFIYKLKSHKKSLADDEISCLCKNKVKERLLILSSQPILIKETSYNYMTIAFVWPYSSSCSIDDEV